MLINFADAIVSVKQVESRHLLTTTTSAYWLEGLRDPFTIKDRQCICEAGVTVQPARSYADPPPRIER